MIAVPFSTRQLDAFRKVYPDAHIRHLQEQTLLVWTTNRGKRIRSLLVHMAEETLKSGTVRIRKSSLSIPVTYKRKALA